MKKATLIIIILTIVSKLFGFSRDVVLSYFYGASNISDVYLIAYTIPGIIFSFIGTGIATSFIPLYSDIDRRNGTRRADLFTNNLIIVLLILCGIFVFIGYYFSYPIVRAFAMGFDNTTLELAVKFTRITVFGIFISVVIHIFTSYLNLKNNFHIPALVGIPNNIILIISIWLSVKLNIILLPIGVVVSLLAQLFLVLIYVNKNGFKFNLQLDIKDENLRKLVYLALPVVIGVSVNQINVLVDRTIASALVVGGISALNYANRLNAFIQGIFVMSIATVMYPLISKMVVDNNIKGLKKALSDAITGINLIVLPVTIGSMTFTNQVISLLFGRGAFDSQAIILTSSALFFYSLGMVGFGLREILSRAFYSMQDTKTPMINAAIGMVLNIILNIVLSRYLGIGGLALATSIAAIFTTALLFISLRKKIGPFGMKQISISFLKILIASLLMGVLAKLSFNYLTSTLSQNLSLLTAIGVGAVSYFGIIYFMKIEDVDVMIGAIRRKLGRQDV
ncbi:murein biosynthesis integral membrane protein MurJ [Alkaliphilus serpentinus]|uniref:Probable lipid II flippase MurJ n=1 Tax=Alkaliphilus serpentinus TaxID=1482731 RepID=A0A833M9E5_9FIRM|nr:murein biosynthesis integral membrane protein MurJ [Alkaliphilus serpentinus]KAB3529701.1 murein biosynthesis integral membrane protein MurJ [Alkaliphilus serpentinus]